MYFFFKQKTAYEMRISDWSSDVCSSDLAIRIAWWREALEKLPQPPLPGEPVLQALAQEGTGGDAAKCAALAALTDGWLTLIEAETVDTTTLEAHAEQRGARLFALAAELLGADDTEGSLRQMGRGWALVDLASRLSRQKERAEAVAMAADIFAEAPARVGGARPLRSEEHPSELQSLMRISYAVFCLKKKNTKN